MARARKTSPRREDGAPPALRTNAVSTGELVGRAIDRAALANLFEQGARIVTLVGPGGMGKTRLATQFAVDVTSSFSVHGGAGTWFCDGSVMSGPADLCAAIAAVLGIKLASTGDSLAVVSALGCALSRRGRVLLVLDNFETIVLSAAGAVSRLAQEAPEARFLVTSRVALGVPGEFLWPLQGLELPPPPYAEPTTAALLTAPAVDLFVRRARQVRPDLVLDDDAVRAVAAVVTRLDGIPLAIELSASRVGALSPAQILERLGKDPALLARRSDTGRHGSMAAVIEDSLRLVGDVERTCLAECTAFAGGSRSTRPLPSCRPGNRCSRCSTPSSRTRSCG